MLKFRPKNPPPSPAQIQSVDGVVEAQAREVRESGEELEGSEVSSAGEAQKSSSKSSFLSKLSKVSKSDKPTTKRGWSLLSRKSKDEGSKPGTPKDEGRASASVLGSLFKGRSGKKAVSAPESQEPRFEASPEDSASSAAASGTSPGKKAGWFANKKAKKSSASSGDEPAKFIPPSLRPPKKARKASFADALRGTTALHLAVDVGASDVVYWEVTPSSIDNVAPLGQGKALSFTASDILIDSAPLSNRQAKDLAVSEAGEEMVVVNASRQHGLVVATPKERVFNKPVRFAPGALAILHLLKKMPAPTEDKVVGFNLQGGETQLLILYVWGPEGLSLEPCTVVVNPSDLEFAVGEFASSRRMNAAMVDVVFFDNKELLSAYSHVGAYPAESEFLGLPVSKLSNYAAVGGLAFAVLSAGYALSQYQLLSSAKQKLVLAKNMAKQAEDEINAVVDSKIGSIAAGNSINTARALARAQQLWIPGTTMTLVSKAEGDTYEIFMPLSKGSSASVANSLTTEQLMGLVDLAAPENCARTGLNVNGQLNEIQISISCQSGPSGFNRYRLD